MSRITGVCVGNLQIPMDEDPDSSFIISKISGISDLVYNHTEVSYEQTFTKGGGRDIVIVLTIKPTGDFYQVRRSVSKALPVNTNIDVIVFLDFEPYARVTCTVRSVSSDFTIEKPTVSIDLESIYTCLTSYDTVVVQNLPLGVDAQLQTVTHDFTPVLATLYLVSPMAMWYRIYISSDWITIHTLILRTNYGINGVPEGSKIVINSDDENFSIVLQRPGYDDLNIETACDVGEHGFKFIPNEPMIVKTRKLPSGLSGEQLDLSCNLRLSGV